MALARMIKAMPVTMSPAGMEYLNTPQQMELRPASRIKSATAVFNLVFVLEDEESAFVIN
jgi:hypothetical protein